MDAKTIGMNYVAPAVGALLANAMFLSGTKGEEIKTRKLGDMNAYLYPFQLANCVLQIGYAFITDDYFVYTANALGCVGGLMFNIICYAFAKEEVQKRLDALLLSVSVLVLSVALSAGLIIQRTELVQRIVGCTSMAVVLCYFTMPIWDVWTALRTFQRGGLSWRMAMATCCNCACWIIYGLMKPDPFIYGPNLAGALLAVSQLVALCVCKLKQGPAVPAAAVCDVESPPACEAEAEEDNPEDCPPDCSVALEIPAPLRSEAQLLAHLELPAASAPLATAA